LRDENPDVQLYACSALSGQTSQPDFAVESLIRQLRAGDSGTRYHSTKILGWQTSLTGPTIEAVIRLLQDEPPDMRFHACEALSELTSLPGVAPEALIPLVQDADPDARCHAAEAPGCQTSLTGSPLEALFRLLHRDKNRFVQDHTTEAFHHRRHPPPPPPSVGGFCSLIQTNNYPMQLLAAEALQVHAEFYSLIPTLSSSVLQHVLMIWLEQSFQCSATCFIRNHTLSIDINGKSWRIPLKEREQKVIQYMWIQPQNAVGIPLPVHDLKESSEPLNVENE
jgi:hypothetical protein